MIQCNTDEMDRFRGTGTPDSYSSDTNTVGLIWASDVGINTGVKLSYEVSEGTGKSRHSFIGLTLALL